MEGGMEGGRMKFDKFLGKVREKDGGGEYTPNGWVATEMDMTGTEKTAPLAEILDQLSRKSIRTINDNAVDDEDTGNINIYAGDLLMRSSSSGEYYPPTVYDGFYTTDYYKMGVPIYQSYMVLDCESNTDYYAESTGYILLELGVRDGEVPSVPFIVTIDEITVAAIIPAAGTRQTFMFPCPTGASWRCDTPGLPFEFVSIQFIPGEHSMY